MKPSDLHSLAREQPGTTGAPAEPGLSLPTRLVGAPAATALCAFDFMRCGKCGRICTKPEMEAAIGRHGTGRACPCGSLKYTPVNPPWWAFFLPRVLSFAWRRFSNGLFAGWRTARVQCQDVSCGHVWQAVFQRQTPIAPLQCPRCGGQHAALASAVSFGDVPTPEEVRS